MTSGKPLNTLLKFSLPLLAGSVIQNLYNIFDTAIVGHVLGKYALAAVGNSYVPTLIINSIVLGIASGISILVAQLYGSKDKGQICKCYGSVQTLIVAVGFGLAVLFFALAGWIFKAMQIPEEITSPVALYLRIVAAGIPFLAIYNFYSALIKAKGDSRTPIRCICLSCVLNILLDYLFVACFGWGLPGLRPPRFFHKLWRLYWLACTYTGRNTR